MTPYFPSFSPLISSSFLCVLVPFVSLMKKKDVRRVGTVEGRSWIAIYRLPPLTPTSVLVSQDEITPRHVSCQKRTTPLDFGDTPLAVGPLPPTRTPPVPSSSRFRGSRNTPVTHSFDRRSVGVCVPVPPYLVGGLILSGQGWVVLSSPESLSTLA